MTDTYWHTINFYNDVDDPSVLTALMALDLDATIPTLLTGDFNLHSRTLLRLRAERPLTRRL
jgi:hypothetical protein